MSNSLDPDQARHSVGPDLGPNFLQKLADDTSTERLKITKVWLTLAASANVSYLELTSVMKLATSGFDED